MQQCAARPHHPSSRKARGSAAAAAVAAAGSHPAQRSAGAGCGPAHQWPAAACPDEAAEAWAAESQWPSGHPQIALGGRR